MFEGLDTEEFGASAEARQDHPSQIAIVVRSLERYGPLGESSLAFIWRMLAGQIRHLDVGETLVRQGETPSACFVVLDGWGYRYKVLCNGRRQIIAFLLPGDLSDLDVSLLGRMDHTIAAMTPLTVAALPDDLLHLEAARAHPEVVRSLRIKALAEAAVQREWTVNLGQRSAPERIGHVLCEIFHRLRSVGLTDGTRCALPLTQSDLAETTGLSLVHVNKRLRDLRAAGLIILRGKMLTIPDLKALERASLFSPDYLNLHDDRCSSVQ